MTQELEGEGAEPRYQTEPIVPPSEKAIGAIDLGLIAGAIAIVLGLILIRWIRVRAQSSVAATAAQIVDAVLESPARSETGR